jgi:glycosyltransferase involved in cell wall biosynthesis
LGRAAGLPVVIKVHGSDVLLLDQYPGRRARTAEALQSADAVVAVSGDLQTRVIACGADPSRVRVVYDGIDAGIFHPGTQDEARARLGIDVVSPLVLFVGNLVPVKGIDVLVAACAALRRQAVEFRCCLVGQGPLARRLQHQINRLGLRAHVSLMGPVPHARLADWYRAATVVVLPSRSEGVPCVLLESAACGTPFVASRVGGVPEIAHLMESELVPPEDAAALCRALRRRIESPAPRPRAATFSRSHADVARELVRIFSDARASRRHQPGCAAAPAPAPAASAALCGSALKGVLS